MPRRKSTSVLSVLPDVIDVIHRTWERHGWEREFQPGDAVEVDEHFRDRGQMTTKTFAGSIVRRHRVGWLARPTYRW